MSHIHIVEPPCHVLFEWPLNENDKWVTKIYQWIFMVDSFVIFLKFVIVVLVVVEAEMLSPVELVGGVVEAGVATFRGRVRTRGCQAIIVVLVLNAGPVERICIWKLLSKWSSRHAILNNIWLPTPTCLCFLWLKVFTVFQYLTLSPHRSRKAVLPFRDQHCSVLLAPKEPF